MLTHIQITGKACNKKLLSRSALSDFSIDKRCLMSYNADISILGEVLLMKNNFYRTTIRLDKGTYEILNNIAKKENEPLANIIRKTIEKGLQMDYLDESKDVIANIVRQQMDIAIKPHIERLARLSSKSGHMSATSTFLNVQALMDLVPDERRKDVPMFYENARKKAVEYMRTRTSEWDNDLDKKYEEALKQINLNKF